MTMIQRVSFIWHTPEYLQLTKWPWYLLHRLHDIKKNVINLMKLCDKRIIFSAIALTLLTFAGLFSTVYCTHRTRFVVFVIICLFCTVIRYILSVVIDLKSSGKMLCLFFCCIEWIENSIYLHSKIAWNEIDIYFRFVTVAKYRWRNCQIQIHNRVECIEVNEKKIKTKNKINTHKLPHRSITTIR